MSRHLSGLSGNTLLPWNREGPGKFLLVFKSLVNHLQSIINLGDFTSVAGLVLIDPAAEASLMFPNLEDTEGRVNQSSTERRRGCLSSGTFLRGRNLNLRRQIQPLPPSLWELFSSSAAGFSFFLLLLSLPTLSHEPTQCRLVAELHVQTGELHLKINLIVSFPEDKMLFIPHLLNIDICFV